MHAAESWSNELYWTGNALATRHAHTRTANGNCCEWKFAFKCSCQSIYFSMTIFYLCQTPLNKHLRLKITKAAFQFISKLIQPQTSIYRENIQ
jgi:hypothetical protein